MLDLNTVFAQYDDEFLKFHLVAPKLHSRPDLCAFLLLDTLTPREGHDMVSAAEHDEIYLDVDVEKLAGVATEADILTLVRCGVVYDKEVESLKMFA